VTAIGLAVFVARPDAPEMITPALEIASTTAVAGAEQPTSTAAELEQTVVVHVAGLVSAPGVFELPVGSRVVDALEAAGGAQPGVDVSTLNLARVLVDGEQIAVGVPAAPDAAGTQPADGAEAHGLPLNLNTATEAELDALPGVGPVLAGRIVAWRSEHGPFTAVEELLEVSGIGTATLENLIDLVRV
jgi:competence protein ComEA